MSEPTSTATAAAIAAGAITLTGSILGINFDALLVGFVGTIAALSFQNASTLLRLASGILLSTLCAGSLSPLLANALFHFMPWLAASADPLRIPIAGLLGMTSQLLFPAVIKRATSIIAGSKGEVS